MIMALFVILTATKQFYQGNKMSNIGNVVAFDGAAAPVSHTLVPISVTRKGSDEVVAEYREQLSTLPLAAQVRLTQSLQKLKSGVFKVTNRIVVPVMESINGANSAGYTAAPKVAYENTVIITGLFSERSTIAERRLARQMAINIGNNVTVTTAAATTGSLPDLFDALVAPT